MSRGDDDIETRWGMGARLAPMATLGVPLGAAFGAPSLLGFNAALVGLSVAEYALDRDTRRGRRNSRDRPRATNVRCQTGERIDVLQALKIGCGIQRLDRDTLGRLPYMVVG